VLVEILPFPATGLTNDFCSPPRVISDSKDEEDLLVEPPARIETIETRAKYVTMRMRPARTEAVMFNRKEVIEFLDKYN
jgi:hypothetical protein